MHKVKQLLWYTMIIPSLLLLSACSSQSTEIIIPGLSETSTTTDSPTQTPTFTPTPTIDPFVINASNADELTFLTRFGDRIIDDMAWSPDGTTIAVMRLNYIFFYETTTLTPFMWIDINEFIARYSIPITDSVYPESIEYSRDGKILLITLSKLAGQLLIDSSSYELINHITLGTEFTYGLIFSPDIKLVAGNESSLSSDGELFWSIYIWDLETSETRHILQEGLSVSTIAFSPDSTMLATSDDESPIKVWDTQTGELIQTIYGLSKVTYVSFSSDGQRIVAGDNNNVIKIWDLSGKLICTIEKALSYSSKTSLAFNLSNEIIAIGESGRYVYVFDMKTGKLLKEFDTEYSLIKTISFSPDGRILAAVTSLNGIVLWTTESYKKEDPLSTPLPDQEMINNYLSLPSGKYILYTDGMGMKVISEDGKYKHEISTTKIGRPISADGRIQILVGDESEYLNLVTGTATKFEHIGAVSPNVDWIAYYKFCDDQIDKFGLMGISIIDDTKFCAPFGNILMITDDLSGDVLTNPQWSPDTRWLASIRIADPHTGSSTSNWTPLSTNGLYLVDTSCFQDPQSCNEKTRLAIHFSFSILCNSMYDLYTNWSPDSTYYVVNTQNSFIILNLQNNTTWEIASIHDTDKWPPSFGISPDNQWIAYSSDRTNILLQPLNSNSTTEIASGMENVEVLGWLTAPLLKVDESFVVLPAGGNVQLRKHPGLDSLEIGKLDSGNNFTVLKGPVQEDGYTWWFVRSHVDGTEGWLLEFYEWYAKE